MAVPPINISRVSSNLQTITLIDSLRRNTVSLYHEQNRVSSGYRFTSPSQDPVSAAKALNLTELLDRQSQILANARHADSLLSATDSAIGGISDLLIQARSIASEMVNSTTSQEQRDSSAELVLGMIDELVRTGNRTLAGVYLFGGQQSTKPPFVQSANGITYVGDTNALTSRLDFDHDTAVSLTGSELFGALSSEIRGTVDFDPVLTADTRLADLNGAAGTGINRGVVRVTLNSPATSFVADLSTADSVGDVIDLLNGAAAAAGLTTGPGGDFNAGINAASGGIDITAGAGTVTVAEAGQGLAARDLGIVGAGATISGLELNPRVTLTTPIADLFGGAGAALGSIQIQNGTEIQTVDLSGAQTVQQLLNAINSAGVDVVASINAAGTGIDVVNRRSGSEMRIGEAGGSTATLLGIRSMTGDTTLVSLNHGRGVTERTGKDDFLVTSRDGSTFSVNIDGARTVQDVINLINSAATAAGVAVTAGLATTGNGIQLTDGTVGAGELRVQALNLSAAAADLGIHRSADVAGGGVLTGSDVRGIRTDSVFTALMDLYTALRKGDTTAITDAGGRIGEFVTQVNRVHGMVGARSQAVTTHLQLTEDAVTSTQAMLSEVRDLDYTEAITRFQQAQTTLQANLLTGSKLMQLSLLDFIG